MAWKLLQPEQPNPATQAKPDVSLADAIAAKTNSRLNTIIGKTSGAPKAANDHEGTFSMSGKAEVPSTESRLDELRKALAKHAEEMQAVQPEVAEVTSFEPEAIPTVVTEKTLEPVLETKEPAVKASFAPYTSFSGINLKDLPKHIPEAKDVGKLMEINQLQTTMKLEVGDLKNLTVNADKLNKFISELQPTGISKEFLKRIASVVTTKREEATKKASEIVAGTNEKIALLQTEVGEIDPTAVRLFEVISGMHNTAEMPKGYKVGGGKELWRAANDNSPANALIKALKKAA